MDLVKKMMKSVNLTLSGAFGKKSESGSSSHPNYGLPDYDDEKEIENFFEELVFAVDQPNKIELGEIIKKEVGEELNYIDRENVYARFQRDAGLAKREEGIFSYVRRWNEIFW